MNDNGLFSDFLLWGYVVNVSYNSVGVFKMEMPEVKKMVCS